MNKKQLIAMWIGIAVIVIMGLFPPFYKERTRDREHLVFMGYHLFLTSSITERYEKPILNTENLSNLQFELKKISMSDEERYGYRTSTLIIDFSRLRLQWLFVVLIMVGAVITFRVNQKSEKSSPSEESPESN